MISGRESPLLPERELEVEKSNKSKAKAKAGDTLLLTHVACLTNQIIFFLNPNTLSYCHLLSPVSPTSAQENFEIFYSSNFYTFYFLRCATFLFSMFVTQFTCKISFNYLNWLDKKNISDDRFMSRF